MARRKVTSEANRVYSWEDKAIRDPVCACHKTSKTIETRAERGVGYGSVWGRKHTKVSGEFMTMAECRKFVTKVCHDYGLNPPEVIPVNRNAQHATGGYFEIRLPAWGRNKAVLLHEIAHTIVARMFHGAGGHDKTFVRVYIELVAQYTHLKKMDLVRSAKAVGIPVASAQSIGALAKARATAKENKQQARKGSVVL
jgi:hypothetical protein